MSDKSFLGTGMKFPPQVNSATGRFLTASETESVKESIYLILMTAKTERIMRPDFGSNLMEYTFMDINETSVNMMKRSLASQLIEQEPRISDVRIETDTESKKGCMIVYIDYLISSTNTRENIVFPFYLNTVAEEEEYEPESYIPEQIEEV